MPLRQERDEGHTKYKLGDISAEKGIRKRDAEKARIQGMIRMLSLARKRAATQISCYHQRNLCNGERKGARNLTLAEGISDIPMPMVPVPGSPSPARGG